MSVLNVTVQHVAGTQTAAEVFSFARYAAATSKGS